MALITGLVPLCFEQMTYLGGMGIMAGDTFASLQGRMDIRLIQTDLFFAVTGIADFIPIFLQNKFWNNAMSDMTILTFLSFDDGMDVLHPHVFFYKFFMAFEAIFTYEFFTRRWGTSQCPFLLRSNVGV
jgi:hypothetical protein